MSNVIDLRKQKTDPKQSSEKQHFSSPPERPVQPVQTPPSPDPKNVPEEHHETARIPKKILPQSVSWQTTIQPAAVQMRRIIFLAIVAGGILWMIEKNVLAIAVLGIAVLVIAIQYRKGPQPVAVTVSSGSIIVNGQAYHLRELKSFWIEFHPHGVKEISLETQHWYAPYVKVPLGNQNPTAVRLILAKGIPEKEHEVSLLDSFLGKV